MGQILRFTTDSGFTWIDVVDPTRDELEGLAKQYGLHDTSVDDVLDPEHLPKFERFDNVRFIILRAYNTKASPHCDTVEEMTRKIALFSSENFLVSVHRMDWPFFQKLRDGWDLKLKSSVGPVGPLLLSDILEEAFLSYEKPIDNGLTQLEQFEMGIFNAPNSKPFMIEDGYYLKRQAFVYKRILRYTHDVLTKISVVSDPKVSTYYQDLRETLDSIYFYADELVESVNSLLNLHISLSSQRTNEASHRANEIMRVLTIFSIFFLPLNFLAGIYGMNFHYMPELSHPMGYPTLIGIMVLIAFVIFLWIRRKGWLD